MTVPDFPSLRPAGRSWTPGYQPMSAASALNGYETRVLLGAAPVSASLALSFENMTDAAAKLIADHHVAVRGGFDVFELPSVVFAGMSSYGHLTPAGSKWRYAEPPQMAWSAPDVVSVTVSLMAVPT